MKTILQDAHEIIYGDREQTYGDPGKNLRTIASFWENYLDARGLWNRDSPGLSPKDVAYMMSLLKIARLANDPEHRDSQVDACGYMGLAERVGGGF
jgi:hypothetical protein